MINTYGITMVGLEEASAATADWPIGYANFIRYDPNDGKVWIDEGTDDRIPGKYDVFRTRVHVSAQHIADKIAEYVRLHEMTPQARYDAKNTVMVSIKLNRATDADIIACLQSQPSRQGFIKQAIRKYLMECQKGGLDNVAAP